MTTRTHTVVPSPIGDLTLVAHDGALAAVHMDGAKHTPEPASWGERDDRVVADVREQLGEYFARDRTTFDLALAPVGNAFEQRVWALLREIPYGQTRSYGDLARALGDVGFSQAVGAANGRNPIAVIVPCHRVIGADGSLVGYAGGLDRKRFLLALEESEEVRATRLF
ncbi:methylated-DNA--[protein]-cysteine S-methyltransferase [Pedococcus aerophilus]|uniref:Methylated-DNA--protein-cysteine methyltransferase n=1 Tax=Pedococcus aerophilus TaxID=436356 RepID=A0ABN3UJM2_9MICO